MKKSILLMAIAIVMLAGCRHKTTQKDLQKAEAALFNEDQTMNMEAVPTAIDAFDKYAQENPEAENAADYLFRAFEVAVNTHQEPQQSIDLATRLLERYPDYDKNSVALFMLATFVYDEQLHDLDQARDCYQRIIDSYPDSPFAADAAIAIQQLGMTPEELIKMFESKNGSGL